MDFAKKKNKIFKGKKYQSATDEQMERVVR